MESTWKPASYDVFPQLSPQALKKIQVPAPEYTGLHSENTEIEAMLKKFEDAKNRIFPEDDYEEEFTTTDVRKSAAAST